MREIVAYVVLFGSALVGGTLLTNFISLVVKRTGLSGTDRMLGMVFGAARGLVIILALVILMPSMLTDIEQDLWWKNSQLIPHFQLMTEWSEKTFSEIVEWVGSFVGSHRDSGGAAASANSAGGFQADGLSFSQAQDSPAAEVNSQSPVHGSPQVQRQGN
jgi:membrane protein required for colicin V production